MFDLVEQAAKTYPDYTAFTFMGKSTSFTEMIRLIHQAARSFAALGIREGDKVTLCLPNTPQTVVCFYALNLIGAIANMIHPLSSEGEIAFYLQDSQSVAAVTLDQFYGKFKNIEAQAAPSGNRQRKRRPGAAKTLGLFPDGGPQDRPRTG